MEQTLQQQHQGEPFVDPQLSWAEIFAPFYVLRMAWIVIGMSFLGYLTKAIDTERGEVRAQNMYAGAFTFVIGIVVADWLYKASGGSLEGLHDVLNDGYVDPDLLLDANLVNALLFGYMVQDIIARVAHWDLNFDYGLHHLACIIGLIQHLWFGHNPTFCLALAFGEFSTPVVCVLEMAQHEKMDHLVLPSGLLLNIMFPFRVMWFAWAHYIWTFEYSKSPFVTNDYSLTIDAIALMCSLVLLLLNVKWFFVLVTKTIQALVGGNAEKATKVE